MGVLLQGFYKRMSNLAVPSPADGDSSVDWWWDHLARQARDLGRAGFSAIWLPPVLKAAQGSAPSADGYSPFDDYDLGSRDQRGGFPTRFGAREQLQRCVAVLRCNGLDVYVDMVEHHRLGDTTPFTFRYPGADGTADAGRFPKDPLNFLPQVPRDPNLGGAVSDDRPFGRELAPINGLPSRSVADQLVAAADWMTRALGIQGYRIDDAKGLSTDFLEPFLNSKTMLGKFAVGEFFDGNITLLNGWISNPKGMQGRSSAFDFPLKFILTSMCNNPGRFNMADLDHAGLAGVAPFSAVTFVENHDTDLDAGQRIVTNKLLGYAYILTSEGYPCVYYRDYSTDPGCYGLKRPIDNLIWIHEKLAAGGTQPRWKEFDIWAYERTGGPRLLVGLNNDPVGPHTITVATGFGPNVLLHDYAGHADDVTTSDTGAVTITLPPNRGGAGYVCYSRAGFAEDFNPQSHPVSQDFEGAEDLDILPALTGGEITIGRIWSGAHLPITALLQPDHPSWTEGITLTLSLTGPDNRLVASLDLTKDTPADTILKAQADAMGYYTLGVTATPRPQGPNGPIGPTQIPFRLSVGYQGSLELPNAGQQQDPVVHGKWGDVFDLGNVAIHAHLLPSGKVLYWGRRQTAGAADFPSLNEHDCFPFLFDPASRQSRAIPHPIRQDGSTINLFCSSHTFLADGTLLVVGGHYYDSQGIEQSTIYDWRANSWTPGPVMRRGRWYPTVVTLGDGSAVVFSGSYADPAPQPPPGNVNKPTNNVPEHWSGGPALWTPMIDFFAATAPLNQGKGQDLTLFPRMHLAPDGRIFMAGTAAQSFFFDTAGLGAWTPAATRVSGPREYAPSVMFDIGKVVYIGGGNNPDDGAPTNVVETIDLTAVPPQWKVAPSMHFPRRQHNATILPDGTVLVTGGTRGPHFNDVNPGMPVRTSELWNPTTGNWTLLADELVDRCYHSTAVLLPDGRVLSGGGGEYQPTGELAPNPADQSHRNAQIFEPPYLFRGPRPVITNAPDQVGFGTEFDVAYDLVPEAQIAKVSMIRLSSVTHSFNQNQRINFPDFALPRGGHVRISAPTNTNICPPGHYLLFLLTDLGVPSVARIIHMTGHPQPEPRIATLVASPVEMAQAMRSTATKNPVRIGLTSSCPYGCWGNALTVMPKLKDVEMVLPVVDPRDWMITVYLAHDGLPDLDKWREQVSQLLLGSYVFRGVEVTLEGSLDIRDGDLFLLGSANRPEVKLATLHQSDVVALPSINTEGASRLVAEEAGAYLRLQQLHQKTKVILNCKVTGTLQKTSTGYALKVRHFDARQIPQENEMQSAQV